MHVASRSANTDRSMEEHNKLGEFIGMDQSIIRHTRKETRLSVQNNYMFPPRPLHLDHSLCQLWLKVTINKLKSIDETHCGRTYPSFTPNRIPGNEFSVRLMGKTVVYRTAGVLTASTPSNRRCEGLVRPTHVTYCPIEWGRSTSFLSTPKFSTILDYND